MRRMMACTHDNEDDNVMMTMTRRMDDNEDGMMLLNKSQSLSLAGTQMKGPDWSLIISLILA